MSTRRQLLNILHVMYLYNQIKEHPDMDIIQEHLSLVQRQLQDIRRAKQTIKLINSVADVINNDAVYQRQD